MDIIADGNMQKFNFVKEILTAKMLYRSQINASLRDMEANYSETTHPRT